MWTQVRLTLVYSIKRLAWLHGISCWKTQCFTVSNSSIKEHCTTASEVITLYWDWNVPIICCYCYYAASLRCWCSLYEGLIRCIAARCAPVTNPRWNRWSKYYGLSARSLDNRCGTPRHLTLTRASAAHRLLTSRRLNSRGDDSVHSQLRVAPLSLGRRPPSIDRSGHAPASTGGLTHPAPLGARVPPTLRRVLTGSCSISLRRRRKSVDGCGN